MGDEVTVVHANRVGEVAGCRAMLPEGSREFIVVPPGPAAPIPLVAVRVVSDGRHVTDFEVESGEAAARKVRDVLDADHVAIIRLNAPAVEPLEARLI